MRPTLLALIALTWTALPLAAQHGTLPHWEYEGTHGPANWGTLDTAYRTCLVGKQRPGKQRSRTNFRPRVHFLAAGHIGP